MLPRPRLYCVNVWISYTYCLGFPKDAETGCHSSLQRPLALLRWRNWVAEVAAPML